VEPPAAASEMIITLHFEEVIAMMSPSGRFEQDAASRRMRRFSEWAKERISAEERLSFEEPVSLRNVSSAIGK
jgi:hypothetical protein